MVGWADIWMSDIIYVCIGWLDAIMYKTMHGRAIGWIDGQMDLYAFRNNKNIF